MRDVKRIQGVPVFVVVWTREVVGKREVNYVKEGLKDFTTDFEQAHCFLFEHAAKRYIELSENPRLFTVRVYFDLEDVKKKYPNPDPHVSKLLTIWEKISRRVFKYNLIGVKQKRRML